MCDCRNDGGCEQQSYRLQPCNGLQSCDNCNFNCNCKAPPPSKLSSRSQQQNLSGNGQSKKSLPKGSRGSISSNRKISNAQQKNISNNSISKKASKKAKQSSGKTKNGAQTSRQELESDEGADISESEDNPNETKEFDNHLQSESMLGMLQPWTDHTMRAYFMHTMEKIECLSAQLLRNEGLVTKMHLEFVEKICMLSQRNVIQFQALIERLNYLYKDQQKDSPRKCKCYNSEEEVYDMEDDVDHQYEELTRISNDKAYGTRQGSLTSYTGSLKYGKIPENTNSFSSDKQQKADKKLEKEELKPSDSIPDLKNDSECYCECQKKIRCLQQALSNTKNELDESLKRLEKIRESKSAYDMNLLAHESEPGYEDLIAPPTKLKSPVSDPVLEDDVEPKLCCCSKKKN